MNSSIKVLDQHAANQIAAGEVVERPVSVIKELVENSLDAGARNIHVYVEGGGLPFLQVQDDGCGLVAADLPLALQRHATSKLSGIEDLNSLQTLGFRGEALPSIASVSRFEIFSRPSEAMSGHKLILEAGTEIGIQEIGCPVGTTITVRDLFFNTPARRKFLRSPQTEFGLISDMLGRLALTRPDVAFTLAHPRQVVFQTTGRGKLLETIGSVLGNDTARRLLPIHAKSRDWALEGFISPPDLVRSNKQGITTILNGRVIRSSIVTRALQEGYHTLIPAKLHPIAVLHLHIPPDQFDVNVHPTKMDVRFDHEHELSMFIADHINRTLLADRPITSFDLSGRNSAAKPLEQKIDSENFRTAANPNLKELPEQYTNLVNLAESTPGPLSEQCGSITTGEITRDEPGPTKIDQLALPPDQAMTKPNLLHSVNPLAQIFNTYVLATDGKNLILIDQHAAHERINYERLLEEVQTRISPSQGLLVPIPLEFSLQEEQVILEHMWALRDLGFVLEQFGPRTYLVRGVPACSGPLPGEELLRQFIDKVLQSGKEPSWEKLLEDWIYLLACKESIKANDHLSILEMEQLIARLGETKNPYTCPHGRPTMIQLARADLEKRFYRR